MLLRLLTLTVALGVLAAGGWAVKNNVAGIRDRATQEVTALMDNLLGVRKPAPERLKPAPKAVAVKPVPNKPVAPVAPPPPTYVDRSPTPSALERVKPDDRARLENLIAQRTATNRSVAARDEGAKRHVP